MSARSRGRWLLCCDPTTFIGAFALWAVFNAVALLAPQASSGPGTGPNPVNRLLLDTPLPARDWGMLMLADALCLLACLMTPRAAWQSFLSLISGGFWMFFGLKLTEAAFGAGFFSAGGAFCISGGVLCLLASVQWMRRGEGG